jgi:gliding motility-associated-like protein
VIVSRLDASFIGERSCFGDLTEFIDFSTQTDLPILTWQWDFGVPNATSNLRNPTFTYNTADSFLAQLVISDAIGCTDTATQIVIIDTPATAVAGYDATICFGESIQLFSSGGDTVFWTPIDSPGVFNPWVTPSSTTVYTAHITNGVCPFDLADVVITVIPPPEISTIDNTTILRGESIELTTTVDRYDSILWVPSDSLSCVTCLSPVASPWQETTYIITVIDEFGCTNTTEVTIDVEVQCKEDQVWVANAFMPKLAVHEENRFVQVRLRGVEKLNYFRIYDRWGKLMFETDDENEKWDGTNLDGQELNGGVYVYVCEAVCWFRNTIVKTGNVTLVR